MGTWAWQIAEDHLRPLVLPFDYPTSAHETVPAQCGTKAFLCDMTKGSAYLVLLNGWPSQGEVRHRVGFHQPSQLTSSGSTF